MALFSGKLSRTDYWKKLIGSFIPFFFTATLLLVVLDLQDAELPGASVTNQVLSIALFALLLLSIIVWIVYLFSLAVRRGRDAGHAVLLPVLAYFMPLGVVVIGLIPSRK